MTKNKRILATFVPEAWDGDDAIEIDDRQQFDVTEQIEAMGRETALKLRDNRENTDALVPSEILSSHNGPYKVLIEDAVREYFGVNH